MPSINMIAPRRAEKLRLESNVRKLLMAIFIEALVIVCVAGFLVTKVYKTRSMISDLDVQLSKLQPTVNKIEEFEKATQSLTPKLGTLNDAKAETLRWCRMLNDVSISLPDKMWLTRISAAVEPQQPDNISVTLSGVAVDQGLVGQTMLRMHDMVTDFEGIDLHYTQKTIIGPLTAVEFEMAAAMKPLKKTDKEVGKS